MKKVHVYLTIALIAFLTQGCQKNINSYEATTIEKAILFLETNETNITLPYLETFSTKTTVCTNEYLMLWDQTVITTVGNTTLLEVPFSGPKRLKASFITNNKGRLTLSKATSRSYLVFEYHDNSDEPMVYVETYIQKGGKCRLISDGNYRGIRGFAYYSDLHGNITARYAFIGGHKVSFPLNSEETNNCCHSKVCSCANSQDKKDYVGYRVFPVQLMANQTRT